MTTLSANLNQAYQETPDRVAIILQHSHQPDQTFTYRNLLERAAGFARSLSNSGVQPGDVVILILNYGIELVTAFLGAVLCGAIPSILPYLTEKLSPQHYRVSLRALFEVTRPAAVITFPGFSEEITQASVRSSIRVILSSMPAPTSTIPDWEQFAGVQCAPASIALLQHSSGTTGLQKGVALSHQAIFNQLDGYSKAIRLNEQDVIVSWLPLYHDMGLIAGFLLPILSRSLLILQSPFDWVRAPYRLMQAISQYHGSLCWLPNFAYNFCAKKIRDKDLQGVNLSSLRAVINCSEPMHWNSHQMFLERFQPYGLNPSALSTCYAMAENVFAVTQGGITRPVTVDWIDGRIMSNAGIASRSTESSATPQLSAGQPIANCQVRIVDPTGKELAERHVGEIALRSSCMLSGYFNRPDIHEDSFVDGWFLTGDLGYLADGELFITGRKKDLIIVGGKNIYPQDIERLASEIEGVHPGRVVAFGLFDEGLGTEEVVVVAELDVPAISLGKNADQIANLIRQRVNAGSDISLRLVHLVERNWLIKTSSGKIARQANRQKFLAQKIDGLV